MNPNNQSDDDIRFSGTTGNNRKRAKKEQDCPEVIVALAYASKKAAQCMMTAATFIAPAPCLSTYITAPV
jgi:hypothetical protein